MGEKPATNDARPTVLARYGCLIALLLLLAGVATVSLVQAQRGKFDFHHFYLDARYVWQHGELNPDLDNPDKLMRRQLPFYLPAVPLLLSPAACGGQQLAAVVWAAGQTISVAIVLWVLLGWCRTDKSPRSCGLLLVTCVVSVYAVYEAAKFNQLTLPVLALLMGAFSMLERERPCRAGLLFGLAAVVKLLPGLLVVWLVLKRQWTALGALLATVALVTLLPPLAAFGPRKTLEYHRQWLEHNLRGAPAQGMAADNPQDERLDDHFIDRRNQALPLVFARLFSPDHPKRVSYQPVTLSAGTCVWLARGVLALLLAGLVWQTRRPWRALGSNRQRLEFAAYLLGMIVFSPLVRQYYLAWALPALLLFAQLARPGDELPWRHRRIGQMGIALWLLGMLVWMWEPARVCGAHWLMLALMAALLLVPGAGKTPDPPVTNPPGRTPPIVASRDP